jgi:two-component system, OmpR family, KDP operon response regulator KdpE
MNSLRILVVDDEAAIRRFLKIILEADGHTFLEASSGQEGLVMAATNRPDMIVLDLGLPDLDGLVVLKRLREWSAVPVIVLTVRDSENDKVALLDAGADDYLTKPFSTPEFQARIRVAIRHKQPAPGEPIFRSGELEVDLSDREVRVRGQAVKLTATEYEILRILVLHAGKVVTQRQLLKEVWGPNALGQTHYLRVYVGQLRKKLQSDTSQPRLIVTEPGIGYRLKIMDT